MSQTKKPLKTPAQVKADLRAQGLTLKQFAKERELPVTQVYRVMNGTLKGCFGRAHEISVALGIK